MNRRDDAIRRRYERHGVEGYYAQHGGEYRNPHERIVRELISAAVQRCSLDLDRVLDLACGSGEATLMLRELGAGEVDGVDPFTGDAYLARTGQPAEGLSFEQVAAGALASRRYNLIVCSFAMHLIDKSRLPGLLAQLALIADRLLIVTPHKRPEIKAEWGWTLVHELMIERVRARLLRPRADAGPRFRRRSRQCTPAAPDCCSLPGTRCR